MGKWCCHFFSTILDQILFILAGDYITYIRAWKGSKFGQIRSGTTELATLEHLKIDVGPLSLFSVVVISGKESGERLQGLVP